MVEYAARYGEVDLQRTHSATRGTPPCRTDLLRNSLGQRSLFFFRRLVFHCPGWRFPCAQHVQIAVGGLVGEEIEVLHC